MFATQGLKQVATIRLGLITTPLLSMRDEKGHLDSPRAEKCKTNLSGEHKRGSLLAVEHRRQCAPALSIRLRMRGDLRDTFRTKKILRRAGAAQIRRSAAAQLLTIALNAPDRSRRRPPLPLEESAVAVSLQSERLAERVGLELIKMIGLDFSQLMHRRPSRL